MSITNVTSTSVTPSGQSQGQKRGFQRVSGTSGSSSFTPAGSAPATGGTGAAQQATQPNAPQPKSFKGRGQFVNLLV